MVLGCYAGCACLLPLSLLAWDGAVCSDCVADGNVGGEMDD